MTINFTPGADAPADLLAATAVLYREIAEELVVAMRNVKGGEIGEVTGAARAVKDLRDAYKMIMDERTRVDTLRSQVAGVAGGTTLDFDAARDEIGRRLACLRDAGTGG